MMSAYQFVKTQRQSGSTYGKILNELSFCLPEDVYSALSEKGDLLVRELKEIRFSVGKPVMFDCGGQLRTLKRRADNLPIIADKACMDRLICAVSNGSMYSVNETIMEGFVTIRGGHRVGFCGTAVVENNEVRHIKNVSAACIRVSREVVGCAGKLKNELCSNGRIPSILIVSPPGCGKTTILRDICRMLGNGQITGCPVRVGIADERNEIAAVYEGVPQTDIGLTSFVCDGYTKSKAMNMMLRSMSPQVLATDEIGSEDDFSAIFSAALSGVSVIATAHAASIGELFCRYGKSRIWSCFDAIAILRGRGTVDKIYRRTDDDC